jgi:hypothetical protein
MLVSITYAGFTRCKEGIMANNPLNLDSPREWYETWWVSSEPEKKVPGVLRYNLDDGLILSLIRGSENKILVFQSNLSLSYHS